MEKAQHWVISFRTQVRLRRGTLENRYEWVYSSSVGISTLLVCSRV